MMFTPATLVPSLPDEQAQPWWLGFSGGLDSTVLLYALVQLGLPVRAVHINHQLSPNADRWEAQCAQRCSDWGVEFSAHRVQVVNQGRGIEDAARTQRYQVFQGCLAEGGVLLTAHHADDQAETLLLRLLRGTGPRGLAAMARQRSLGAGSLWRPLLDFTRAQLETYAIAQGLTWVEDESNANHHYDRNFLRLQVMPLLQQRWPGFQQRWQQTAELCADNEQLLDELCQRELAEAEYRRERLGSSIRLAYWRSCAPARQTRLLRYWLRQENLSLPERQHWPEIFKQLAAAADAEVNIRFGSCALRLYRARIFAVPVVELRPLGPTKLTPGESLSLPLGSVCLEASVSGIRLKASLPELTIRMRCGGERAHPIGRQHSQSLKKLLQECGLEPWLRDHLPLLYSGEQLVAVGDLWICQGFAAAEREPGLILKWSVSG